MAAENGPQGAAAPAVSSGSPVSLAARLGVNLSRGDLLRLGLPLALFLVAIVAPAPPGLAPAGQRALAVMGLAVALWSLEALPLSVTGLLGVALLALAGAVPNLETALHGFSQPVVYFLLGILTLGMAAHRSGLAERLAIYLIRLAGGSPRRLYIQMLLSFALLTFALPSASTRGAIMVHIYEQALAYWRVPIGSPLNKAVMMGMGVLNRLGSTALLAGGITPVVASSLLGDFSWGRWFVLMSVPFYANLILGGALMYFHYRAGFNLADTLNMADLTPGAVKPAEWRAALIILGTALLWFTDFLHGLPPAVPALLALVLILLPGVGLLSWRDFERDLGWSNFFVIATSLSLAHAVVISGAAAWFSTQLVGGVGGLTSSPLLALLALGLTAAVTRLMIPNIAGYLALVIPIAMSTGAALGLNPLVCGMTMVVVGDSVIYYAAQSSSSVFIFQRANLRSPEIFKFGLLMTLVALVTLFALAVPWWSFVGEKLAG